eukprot:g2895.t1
MSSSAHIIRKAKIAIEADRNGRYEEAIDAYKEAVRYILERLEKGEIDNGESLSLKARAKEYLQRIEVLEKEVEKKKTLQMAKNIIPIAAGTMVMSNPAGPSFRSVASTAAVGATTGLVTGAAIVGTAPITLALAGGASAGYMATRSDNVGDNARKVGEVGQKAFAKARSLDKKYDISGKTTRVLSSGYEGAVALDKKYDISRKTTRVASGGYKGAVALNEKYDVTGKTSRAVVQGYEGAVALNKKYDITGKTKSAAGGAWNAAKSGAAKASEINERYKITENVTSAATSAWSAIRGGISGGS